jgi:hypothetical protein
VSRSARRSERRWPEAWRLGTERYSTRGRKIPHLGEETFAPASYAGKKWASRLGVVTGVAWPPRPRA